MIAGIEELKAKGVEGFSLRSVAKRAGVSHAAPAHHFGDANGLLTAIAAHGYELFNAMQDEAATEAGPDPRAILLASGLAYVAFAEQHHALFRLIFASDRPDFSKARLANPADAAFQTLERRVQAATGRVAQDNDTYSDIAHVWALSHGLADLMASGRLKNISTLPKDQRESAIRDLLVRSWAALSPAEDMHR